MFDSLFSGHDATLIIRIVLTTKVQDKDPRSLSEMRCLILLNGLTKNSWNRKEPKKNQGNPSSPPKKKATPPRNKALLKVY